MGGEQGLGVELATVLGAEHDVVLLSMVDRRSQAPALQGASEHTEPREPGLALGWQPADWFQLRDAEQALRGFDAAVYLGRPTLAAARLLQGSSRAIDRYCADNFARAAQSAGIGCAIDLVTTQARPDPPLTSLVEPFDERFVRLALAAWAVDLLCEQRGAELGVLHLSRVVERVTDWSDLRRRVAGVERVLGHVVASGGSHTLRSARRPPPRDVGRDASLVPRPSGAWSRVRSVQELSAPAGRDAAWIADEYLRWLEGGAAFPTRVRRTNRGAQIRAPMTGGLLLELEPLAALCSADRYVFAVTAGMLARLGSDAEARFEFRLALDGVGALCALVDFAPRLPWPLYRMTQAVLHRRTMARFAAHLSTL